MFGGFHFCTAKRAVGRGRLFKLELTVVGGSPASDKFGAGGSSLLG